MTAPMVIEAYVRQVLLPSLMRGHIVILNNLATHKSKSVRALLAAKGIRLLFLPPAPLTSLRLKTPLPNSKSRRVRAQTFDALVTALASVLDTISPCDAIGFFTHAGFLNLDE